MVQAVSTLELVYPFVHRTCNQEHLTSPDGSARYEIEERWLAAIFSLRGPVLAAFWPSYGIEYLCVGSPIDYRAGALITRDDAERSGPWSFLTASNQKGRLTTAHKEEDIATPSEKHAQGLSPAPHQLCPLGELAAENMSEALNEDSELGKRVVSFNSTSDASTRRSSIWDDGYDDEVESEGDISDTSDEEDDHDAGKSTLEDPRLPPSSPAAYSDPGLALPDLYGSHITILRSPKRRRSSHPALLLLQAENAHLRERKVQLDAEKLHFQAGTTNLQADKTQLEQDQTHLRATNTQLEADNNQLEDENTSLLSQNSRLLSTLQSQSSENARLSTNLRSLRAKNTALSTTTRSLASAQDTISTEQLQISSLRKRVRFLERWVDSLYEEKCALHEEKIVRARALEDLQLSYEKLEMAVERFCVQRDRNEERLNEMEGEREKGKVHDCALEVELEGVRGRLGGLRIGS